MLSVSAEGEHSQRSGGTVTRGHAASHVGDGSDRLWNGGISFGGVASFSFADLIVLPVLNIYRKYYGPRMMLFIAATFYAAMAAAGYVVEFVFGGLGAIPSARHAKIVDAHISLNGDTVLNAASLAVTVVLGIRFVRTGGVDMLRTMNKAPGHHEH